MAQVECQIPHGLLPGQEFHVQANGQTVAVTVPLGTAPGQTIRVALPAAEPQVVYATLVNPEKEQSQPQVANPVVVATPQVVHAQPVARQHVQHAGMATRQYASPYDGSLHAHPALAMGETSLPEIPQGAPPGGRWIHRPAIGIVTCCIAFWLFPAGILAFLCPCDQELVYQSPDGLIWNRPKWRQQTHPKTKPPPEA